MIQDLGQANPRGRACVIRVQTRVETPLCRRKQEGLWVAQVAQCQAKGQLGKTGEF